MLGTDSAVAAHRHTGGASDQRPLLLWQRVTVRDLPQAGFHTSCATGGTRGPAVRLSGHYWGERLLPAGPLHLASG